MEMPKMPEPSGRTTQVQRLLDRLRQGDESARKELHAYTYRRFVRLTKTMLHNDGVHDYEKTGDVWHTAWMKVDAALAKIKFVSARHFLNMVAAVIRHTIVDMGRHYSGPKGSLVRFGHDHDDAYVPADPFAWEDVHKHVASLPDPEREIVDLHIYAGLTLVVIAELQEISAGTVKRKWQSAIQKLRKSLASEAPGS
jgi:RNA polymerase sigma factor (sigma-70 family)